MTEHAQLESERQLLVDAQSKGTLATLGVFTKLSGPGWLQSALTLGGGSLASSLYLGILAGVSMLWLQPFAMILGIIMLSAISYVTLSTGERPFRAINRHINPVLGWSWLAASLIANMVWVMPQYSLCFAVFEQNLMPDLFQGDGALAGGDVGKWVVSIAVLLLCTLVTWSYGSGSLGVKIYEVVLKLVVALVVVCFVGVVVRMSMSEGAIGLSTILAGFVPKMHHLYEPATTYQTMLDAIADPAARQYWSDFIVSQQRDVMLSAFATAVGINMTFLLPYSLLSRGWDKDFRGLATFDLSTGMFIPFFLATSCVVIAAATQFHAKLPEGCVVNGQTVEVPERFQVAHEKQLAARETAGATDQYAFAGPPSAEEAQMSAVLVKRDTYDLALSLEKLFAGEDGKGGRLFSNIIFGIGVAGMTLSTISLLMLISGFIVCEVLDVPPRGWPFRLGCLLASTGVLWPLVWTGGARAWLAVVTSVFGAMLLPVAYITFYLMMNQKSLLGDQLPRGGKRLVWNVVMAIATVVATLTSISAIMKKSGNTGLGIAGAYIALVLIVQAFRKKPSQV